VDHGMISDLGFRNAEFGVPEAGCKSNAARCNGARRNVPRHKCPRRDQNRIGY